uniref:Acetyltransf_18 domain-containing protein n=1 Tax=Gongylonema pulchrum TaxID=637853 RepID=A0A183EPX1_9BILA
LVKNIREVSLQQLIEYDSKFAGANRESFVRSWVYERPDAVSKVVVNSSNEIVGYGTGRLFSIWDSAGFSPVYGDSVLVFLALFGALAEHFKEQIQRKNVVDLRVPSIHLKAVRSVLQGIADVKEVRSSCISPIALEQPDPILTSCCHPELMIP